MRNEPLMEWSQSIYTDRDDLPKKLTKFLELYDDESHTFGYDAYDRAHEIMEMVKDHYPDVDDPDELANLAIADSF